VTENYKIRSTTEGLKGFTNMSRYALKLFNNGTPNPMCIDPLACLVGQMCNYRSNKDLVSNAVSQGLHRSHYEYSRVSFARSLLGVALFFFFFLPGGNYPGNIYGKQEYQRWMSAR